MEQFTQSTIFNRDYIIAQEVFPTYLSIFHNVTQMTFFRLQRKMPGLVNWLLQIILIPSSYQRYNVYLWGIEKSPPCASCHHFIRLKVENVTFNVQQFIHQPMWPTRRISVKNESLWFQER